MLTAPLRPRRRLAPLVLVAAMALAMSTTAAAVAEPASAATTVAAAPRAPYVSYSSLSTEQEGYYGVSPDGKALRVEYYRDYYDQQDGVPLSGFVVRRSGGTPVRDSGWTSSVLPPDSGGDGSALTLSYLKPSTTYDIYVSAVNQYGQSPETKYTMRTASAPDSFPTDIAGSPRAVAIKGGITLSWPGGGTGCLYEYYDSATCFNGGSPITGYRVGRDGYDTGGTGAWSAEIAVDGSEQTFNYLKPGSTYHVYVQAKNVFGYGAKNTFTVTVPTVPNAPTIGTAVAGVSGGAIDAKAVWSKPTNVGGSPASYTVYAYRMSGTTVVETLSRSGVSAAATSYTFPLTRTGSWRFRVKAVNVAGTSAYSAYSNIVAGR